MVIIQSITASLIATLALGCLWPAASTDAAAEKHIHQRRQLRYGREELNATSDFQGIVGGSVQTTPLSYFVKFEGGNVLCGASLISTDTVLTAAHCVDGGFPTSVRIAPTTLSNGIVVNVDTSNSRIHPNWRGDLKGGSDVAVLKLASAVNTTEYPAIKLNDNCDVPYCQGTALTTVGFGKTSAGGSTSDVLKTLDTQYQSVSSTNAFIAVKASSSTGVCQGDSGGPLIINGNTQVGVTSFVLGGCAAGNYDGFARVSTYFGWIQSTVCSISSNVGPNFNCGAAANAWYEARQTVVKGVDEFSQMVGINFRGELGAIVGRLGFTGNDGDNR